jgi:hypothetical protein
MPLVHHHGSAPLAPPAIPASRLPAWATRASLRRPLGERRRLPCAGAASGLQFVFQSRVFMLESRTFFLNARTFSFGLLQLLT